MGLKTELEEVGDRTFQVTQIPGGDSLVMFVKLLRIFGPALGSIAGDDQELGALLEADVGKLGTAIARLCSNLDPLEMLELAQEFSRHAKISLEGQPGTLIDLHEKAIFDETFGGRIDLLLGFIAFSLKVNYRSFLVVKALLQSNASTTESPAKDEKSSESQTT